MKSGAFNAKRPGIMYTRTAEGLELPVIDVTNQAFMVDDGPATLGALERKFAAAKRRHKRIPKPLGRLFLWVVTRGSTFARAFFTPDGPTLGWRETYILKLGPENLPSLYDHQFDRGAAGSPQAASLRIRLQQMAQLLAEGLEEPLREKPDAALHFVNIGGGPAMDSLNALILLKRSAPELLQRSITIHVLDRDESGPRFGANALAALGAGSGPLAGLDVTLRHEFYDWGDTTPLLALMSALTEQGCVIAGSSEGGLFTYGSDEDVVSNLEALRADGRGASILVGSIVSLGKDDDGIITSLPFKLAPRALDEFSALAAPAGYSVADHGHALTSWQVLLKRQ